MIDAAILATYDNEAPDPLFVYGVWVPRKGDNARFPVEVVSNYGVDLTVEVFQKDYEDTGDGVATGQLVQFTADTGRQVIELLGMKELVRFRLRVAREGLPDEDVGVVTFRFLQPAWFETVKV